MRTLRQLRHWLRIREEITVVYIWKSRYLSFPVWVKLD